MTGLNAGQTAEVDQWLAVAAEVERAWPYNLHLNDDAELNDAIRERVEEPWQTVEAGRSYLLCGNGVAAPVEPHPDVIREVARSTAPLAYSSCDRCGKPGVVGVAVVAAPRHLVALALCGLCAAYVNPDEFEPVKEKS